MNHAWRVIQALPLKCNHQNNLLLRHVVVIASLVPRRVTDCCGLLGVPGTFRDNVV